MSTLVDTSIGIDSGWFVGEDKLFTLTVYLPGTTQAQVASNPLANQQDITGWSLQWDLRLSRYHPTVVLTKATGSGIAILTQSGSTLGQLTIDIDRIDTQTKRAGTYYHGLARTNAGLYDVVAEGSAVLRKAAVH